MCEDNEEGRKLDILEDDVAEAIDLGIDAAHLRRAPSMVGEIPKGRQMIDVYDKTG